MSPFPRALGAEIRVLSGSPLAAGSFLVLGAFLAFTWLSGVEWIGTTLVALFVWGPLILIGPVAGHVATVRNHRLWSLALASGAPPERLLAAALLAPCALFLAYLALALPFAAILVLEAGTWWLETTARLAVASLLVGLWAVVAGFTLAMAFAPKNPATAGVLATALSFLALAVPHLADGLANAGSFGTALSALAWATPERAVAVAAGLGNRASALHPIAATAAGLALATALLVVGVGRAPGLDPAAARGWRKHAPALALLVLLLPVAFPGDAHAPEGHRPGATTASPALAWYAEAATDCAASSPCDPPDATASAFEPLRIPVGRERLVHLAAEARTDAGPVRVAFRTPPGLAAVPNATRVDPSALPDGTTRYDLTVTFRLDRVDSLTRHPALFVDVLTTFEGGRVETGRLALVREHATPHADTWSAPAILLAVGIPALAFHRTWRRAR